LIAYLITSDAIGSQDPELGRLLMRNFFLKLLSASVKPSHLLFLERGVQLLLPDSPALDALKILAAEMNTELLACQTCLDYYGIKEKIAVGKISNMPEIIETLHEAEKVIRL